MTRGLRWLLLGKFFDGNNYHEEKSWRGGVCGQVVEAGKVALIVPSRADDAIIIDIRAADATAADATLTDLQKALMTQDISLVRKTHKG